MGNSRVGKIGESIESLEVLLSLRDALGIAAIYYKVKPQFLFVKGAGRIGAAISPSNADDTFFGNPALETDADYLYRRQESVPFEQTKVALGLAVSPIDNGGAGWSRFQVTLGALGRYIAATEQVKPGGGVTIAAGPLTLGAALTMDETRVGTRLPQEEKTIESKTTSLTAGLSFGSLLLDYTKLTSLTTSDLDTGNEMHVDLATISVLLNRFVITGAYRIEHSARGGYEGKTRSLFAKPTKEEIFAGVQFAILPFSQVGVFYNYFLLNEVSAGLTIFF